MTGRLFVVLALGIGLILSIPFVMFMLAGDTDHAFAFARVAYSVWGGVVTLVLVDGSMNRRQ